MNQPDQKQLRGMADALVGTLRSQRLPDAVTMVILAQALSRIMYDAHKRTGNDLEDGVRFVVEGLCGDFMQYAAAERLLTPKGDS